MKQYIINRDMELGDSGGYQKTPAEQVLDSIALKHGHKDWELARYRLGERHLHVLILEAMTEYASLKEQEAYRQAQAGIDKVMDRLKFADESLVKHPDCYTDERIKMALDFISTAFHELEKLKK